MLASVFGYMAFLEPVMALVSLVVFAPQVIFVLLMQRAINRRLNERVRTLRDVSSEIIGNYQNPQNVMDAQAERVEQVFTLDMGIFKLTFAMKFLLNLFHHFGVACVLGLGGWYVVNGQTEIGTVVAFLSGIAAINDPWIDAVAWYRDLAMTRTRYKLLVTGVEQISLKPQS
jgi:ABC-type bacteriocin/lantibiotic exporter with double-glycine peptidase domain